MYIHTYADTYIGRRFPDILRHQYAAADIHIWYIRACIVAYIHWYMLMHTGYMHMLDTYKLTYIDTYIHRHLPALMGQL